MRGGEELIRLDKLVGILEDNKISYARKFKDIEYNGYDSNRCQDFSDEIREDIESLLREGINKGFDGNLKNVIFELTEMATLLSKYNAALKLDGYIEKKEQIFKKIKLGKGEKNMADIKKEVLKYIDDSMMGIDNVIYEEKSEYKKGILIASKDMLKELREKVDGVFDNSSLDAADAAANLLGDSSYGLFAWRDYVGRNMIFDAVNDHLRQALDEADKWCELTKAVNKRNQAKDKDIVKYQEDVFSGFSKIASVKEKGDAFFARLASFEEQFSVQNDAYEKVKQINADIAEIQKNISDVIAALDEGEIMEEEADTQITMLEQDMEIREMEREQYRASINMMNNNMLAMRRLLSKFKRLQHIYTMYQQIEPNLFYSMFAYIDFRQFLDILSYGASESDITLAISYYDNIMENVALQTKHMAMTDERFATINKLMEKEQTYVTANKQSEDRAKEKEEMRKRMEERRRKFARKTSAPKEDAADKQEQSEDLEEADGDIQINDIINNQF